MLKLIFKKNKIVILSILSILFVIIFIFKINFFKKNDSNKNTLKLLKEFNQAYSNNVLKSNKILKYELIASESKIEIFPGHKTKVWSYNNQVPGPTIRIKLGDRLQLKFTNNLPEPTTIHWHGVRVPNAMDGVPDVTQKAIQVGETFIYDFVPKDAGTYWFHPHFRSSEQLEKGLYGVLLVEDEISKKYNKDVEWVIDDWLMTNKYQIDSNFMHAHHVNHNGRLGNVITVNGKLENNFSVNAGERIRLRLINASNARIYRLSFADLNVKAIAVDGLYSKKSFNPENFLFAPGNRIDLDIKIPEKASINLYKIMDTFTKKPSILAQINVFSKKIVKTPIFPYPSNPKVPEWDSADKIKVDKVYNLSGHIKKNEIKWGIDGKIYPEYKLLELKHNIFYKIKFSNHSGNFHPMHLHGQFFKVIRQNGYKANEPFFRDTVIVFPNGSVEIGLIPLDKGTWANHCHIQEHADAGMMTLFKVK